MEIELVLAFISTFVTAFGIITAVVIRNEKRFAQIEARMSCIETKMTPFWDLLKISMPKILSNIITNPKPLSNNNPEKMSKAELEKVEVYLENYLNKNSFKVDIFLALYYVRTLLSTK